MVGNEIKKEFLKMNRRYWSKRGTAGKDGYMLVDCQYNHHGVVMTNMHVAKVVQQKRGEKLLVLPSLRVDDEMLDLIRSYGDVELIDTKGIFMRAAAKRVFSILNHLRKLRTPEDILNLRIDGVRIGEKIYDALQIRYGMATIDAVTPRIRRALALEIAFYYAYIDILRKYDIRSALLGDKEYRYGVLLKLALKDGIPCIAGIDGNTMAMRKYESFQESDVCPRRPSKRLYQTVKERYVDVALRGADAYLASRVSAAGEQHDVQAAYSKDKLMLDRAGLYSRFGLDPKKKVAVVMSHVFPDAPHAQEDMLYDDYYVWLVETLDVAAGFDGMNWLVKPHPSTKFYRCDRTVEDLVASRYAGSKIKILDDSVNTAALFKSVDAIVTCGGTAGLEFACNGVPVVMAAKSAYSGFGFTSEPRDRDEFRRMLRSLPDVRPLSTEQVEAARIVMYLQYVAMTLNNEDYEYVLPRRYFGVESDNAELYERGLKMIRATEGMERTKFERLLHEYIESDRDILVDTAKIRI